MAVHRVLHGQHPQPEHAHAVRQFFLWCDVHGIDPLERIQPVIISAYVEELQTRRSAPTVKQHLAAIKMLFDWLVLGQVLRMNRRARCASRSTSRAVRLRLES